MKLFEITEPRATHTEFDDEPLSPKDKAQMSISKMNMRNYIWNKHYHEYFKNTSLVTDRDDKDIQILIKHQHLWTKNALQAYLFAANVIHKRFPAGEPIIAKSPMYAYSYARAVIHDRWPEGEPAIFSDSHYTKLYQQDIADRKWANTHRKWANTGKQWLVDHKIHG